MKYKELKVGLFSALTLVLFYLGFNYLKGIDFLEKKKIYFAIYENIDQLMVSNPVLVNGYAVGRISHIQILQKRNNNVLVEMEIDSDIIITDSTIAILNSELLGGKSVFLKMGSSKRKLKERDTLRTQVAKGMFDVFSETATPVATDLQTTMRKFNTTIDDFNQEFARLDVILAGLQRTPGLINKTLVTANDNIEELSAGFKKDADKIDLVISELRPTLANFKTLSDSLKQLRLNLTLMKVQQTLGHIDETLARFKKGDNTIGKLMTEDSLYVNLNKVLLSLNALSNHLDDNPKHFLSPFGKNKRKIERDRRKEEAEKKKAEKKK